MISAIASGDGIESTRPPGDKGRSVEIMVEQEAVESVFETARLATYPARSLSPGSS